MAFPVVAATNESATTTAGTSHIVNLPASIVAGQTLLMFMAIGSTAATLNALTGWTELADVSTTNDLKVLWRKADGSEGATTTFTTSAVTRSATIVYRVTGAADPTAVPPQISTVTTGTSVNPNSGSLAPTGGAKDYLWFTGFAKALEEADDDTWVTSAPTTPNAYGNLLQKTAGTAGTDLGGMVGVAYRSANVSSEDPGNFTVAISAAWRAYTVAVHPVTTVASQDTTLTLVPVADPAYTRLSVSVSASGDDAFEDPDGSINVDAAGIMNDATGDWMAFRYQLVDIPRHAQIGSAIPTLILDHNDKNDAEGTWYAQAADHSSTFTVAGAGSNQISSRPRTTASVAWTTNDLGVAGAAVSPPNLAVPVNEVIDRPGWNPGAALTLIYDHNSSTDVLQISSWDHATAAPPELTILWRYRPVVADTVVNLTVSPIADSTVAGPTVVFDPERFVDFSGASGAYASTADRAGLDVTSLDTEAGWWNPARSDTPDNTSGYLELPHHTDFNFAGDHDWRIEFTIPAGETSPNRSPARLINKQISGVNDSWHIYWLANGGLEVGWDTDAGAPRGTVFSSVWTPGHQAHKFWLDVDDAATHWVLRHYTSDSNTIAGPWTIAHTFTSGAGEGPTTVRNSTVPITLGAGSTGGDAARITIHAFEYRAGHDGTLVAQLHAKNYTGVRSYDPAADGLSLIFEDDFPGSALSSNWIDHPPWYSAPAVGDVTVANSILRLRNPIGVGDEHTEVILTGTGGSADPTGEAFQFGYVEARLRYDDNPWCWPAFWMLSTAWMDLYPNYATDPAGCPAGNRNSEIDIIDGGGQNRMFSVLHLNTSSPCSVADQSRLISSILDENRNDPSGRMADWHTYGCRWTADYIYYYFDGQLLGALPTFPTTAQLHNVWISCNRFDDGVPSGVLGYVPEPPKPAEVWVEVDWVRIWQ